MEQARQFYYAVMLSGHACPECGGSLEMIGEGRCRCRRCGEQLRSDAGLPAVPALRRQAATAGAAVRVPGSADRCAIPVPVRRPGLRCRVLPAEDGGIPGAQDGTAGTGPADAGREPVAGSPRCRRSIWTTMSGAAGSTERPGSRMQTPVFLSNPPAAFDLSRYQAHVQAHIRPIPVSLEQIPPLSENRRLDRIWRFIAIIFLAHAGHH